MRWDIVHLENVEWPKPERKKRDTPRSTFDKVTRKTREVNITLDDLFA